MLQHPIVLQSFSIIDQEVSEHKLSPREYEIARRVIHTTADFDYLNLIDFSPTSIESGIKAIQQGLPIVSDVNLVNQGICNLVKKTFNNPLIVALDKAAEATEEKTRSEIGMELICQEHPQAIYLIGNAPTALLALSKQISHSLIQPSLVIGTPVGFVSVIESKEDLNRLDVPQITTRGRKGGSTVAAAIFNALLILAWENR
jgi:precorrin-8X/cobalt-precorrin-8 methylmutase